MRFLQDPLLAEELQHCLDLLGWARKVRTDRYIVCLTSLLIGPVTLIDRQPWLLCRLEEMILVTSAVHDTIGRCSSIRGQNARGSVEMQSVAMCRSVVGFMLINRMCIKVRVLFIAQIRSSPSREHAGFEEGCENEMHGQGCLRV